MVGTGISPAAIVSHHKAFRAVLDWKKDSLKVLRDYLIRRQRAGLAHVDVHGNTIIHFLAIDGNASAFNRLFEDGMLTSEMLKKGNLRGDTTLHEAARFGRCNVVEIMLEKDEGLALERNSLGETPLYVAVASGEKDVYDFVKGKLNKDNGTEKCLEVGCSSLIFSFYLRLLAKRLIGDEEDWSRYTYGERTMEPCKDHGQMNDSVSLQRLNLDSTIDSPKNNGMRNPLFQAVENSIQELVGEILEKFPDAAYTVDKNGKNILHIAVEKKDKRLYDYLKTKVRKDVMLTAMDNQGNTILHLATKQGNSPRIVLGHMNQMAWDVFWFKVPS
ncbi:uncharacterized protein LOC127790887 [Diospyros lotus]|uniref:uncharacterized protein LOC127790887 n=1 Tax=Diospyros lotus TaxID=55363 RepID=UPI002256FCE5|nr:uncharacterized protein LOC127790887 [Diospyros lotus]